MQLKVCIASFRPWLPYMDHALLVSLMYKPLVQHGLTITPLRWLGILHHEPSAPVCWLVCFAPSSSASTCFLKSWMIPSISDSILLFFAGKDTFDTLGWGAAATEVEGWRPSAVVPLWWDRSCWSADAWGVDLAVDVAAFGAAVGKDASPCVEDASGKGCRCPLLSMSTPSEACIPCKGARIAWQELQLVILILVELDWFMRGTTE